MMLKGVVILAAVLGAALIALEADANFAAADGFSGRRGVDCTSCHAAPHPTAPDAIAVLEGLPAAWTAGTQYPLTIRVEGGPMALPAPQPQGGFELDASIGTLHIPAEMAGLMRATHGGMTYLPEGTLMRQWQVVWQAPGLERPPTDATFWLAVLAADGNHIVATNVSDAGEKHDMVATLQQAIPPSHDAVEAWLQMPLTPPLRTSGPGAIALSGVHTDGNATHLAWRFDDGDWQSRATGETWRIRVDVPAGVHLWLRSEGTGRVSPPILITADPDNATTAVSKDTALAPAAFLALLVLLAARGATRRTP